MMQPDVVLGFVASLRSMSAEQLQHIAKISEFSLHRITDLYQFAESALTPAAVTLRLARLDTEGLAVITDADQNVVDASQEAQRTLRNLGLLYRDDDHDTVIPTTRDLIKNLPQKATVVPSKIKELTPIQSLQLADDILLMLEDGPLPLSRSGTVAVAPTRQLHDDFDVPAATVNALTTLLLGAGLVEETAHEVTLQMPNVQSHWSRLTAPQRHQLLIDAWTSSLPAALQAATAASPHTPISSIIDTVFPFASHWRTKLAEHAMYAAAALGSGMNSPSAATELTDIDTVIIQPDGSVVAPGLLNPTTRRVVAEFTRVEHIDIASTFRVDAGAIATTLTRRATAGNAQGASMTPADPSTIAAMDSAKATLIQDITTHAATPAPDSLLRRIADTATRLRDITLTGTSTAPATGVTPFTAPQALTVIRTATPALANELQNDRLLAECRLERTETCELTAHRPISAVRNVLVERRYLPLLRERRNATTPEPVAPDESLERAQTLIADRDTTNTIEGRLQLALRYRLSASVTVSGRDGSERTWFVRPLTLANGRLVSVDDDAEVERTVPIDHIISVIPMEASEARA